MDYTLMKLAMKSVSIETYDNFFSGTVVKEYGEFINNNIPPCSLE